MTIATPPSLLLASQSPRRASLLREAGYRFTQIAPPFHDPPQPSSQHADPVSLAIELARQKAQSLADSIRPKQPPNPPQALIISADTVAIGSDGRLLGQPIDREEAHQMLQGMINATHLVVTGVALLDMPIGKIETFGDQTAVRLGVVHTDELERYLESGHWRGKAGGYNLFELQRDWPFTVTGDPTTVVGLPMAQLVPRLEQRQIKPEITLDAAIGTPHNSRSEADTGGS